jgi:hypothetical protein
MDVKLHLLLYVLKLRIGFNDIGFHHLQVCSEVVMGTIGNTIEDV